MEKMNPTSAAKSPKVSNLNIASELRRLSENEVHTISQFIKQVKD